MPLSGIDDDQVAVQIIKRKIDFFHLYTLPEIQKDRTAKGTGHLIHEAGCFIPEVILRVLSGPCIIRRLHLLSIVKMVEHRADQHFKGGRGRNTRRRNDIAGHIGTESACLKACRLDALYNPCQEREGPFAVRCLSRALHLYLHFRKSLGDHCDFAVIRFLRCTDGVHGDAGAEDLSSVMIHMIPNDLGSSGCRKIGQLRFPESFLKAFLQVHIAGNSCLHLLAVDLS